MTEEVRRTQEGYLLLATGQQRYFDMARNLAMSIKIMDGTRPICLVHDGSYDSTPGDHRLFDDFSFLKSDALYPGFMDKIRLYDMSPYAMTMFVDADCLQIKRDVDTYWEMSRGYPFAITGVRRMEGEWKGADVAALLKQEGAEYLIQMNSGVFCFERSEAAATFFSGLNDFYLRRRDHLGVGLHQGKSAQTDEIYIGLWMGLQGLEPCPHRFGEDSWMSSTWRAFGMRLRPESGLALMRKPRRSTFGIPNPVFGWDRLSPTFVHFVGLKPAAEYHRLAAYFKDRFAEPRSPG